MIGKRRINVKEGGYRGKENMVDCLTYSDHFITLINYTTYDWSSTGQDCKFGFVNRSRSRRIQNNITQYFEWQETSDKGY